MSFAMAPPHMGHPCLRPTVSIASCGTQGSVLHEGVGHTQAGRLHKWGTHEPGPVQLANTSGMHESGPVQLAHTSGVHESGPAQLAHTLGVHEPGPVQLAHKLGVRKAGPIQVRAACPRCQRGCPATWAHSKRAPLLSCNS
eukprot:366467-Chlamydomonas_euryale.AAC.7